MNSSDLDQYLIAKKSTFPNEGRNWNWRKFKRFSAMDSDQFNLPDFGFSPERKRDEMALDDLLNSFTSKF